MNGIVLQYSELLSLLYLTDTESLAGMEADHLPLPNEDDRPAVLEAGLDKLLDHGWLTAHGEHYHADEALKPLLEVIVQPQFVVRSILKWPDEGEQRSWHYVSDSIIVQLSATDSKQFRLDSVADVAAMFKHIQQTLPLRPVPEAISYRATVGQEDAQEIRSLASDWDEVPALRLMVADGLDAAQSIRLFDEIAEPEWRGRVDFIDCRGDEVIEERRILALQGQETSWLAWQDQPDESALHVKTATAGSLEETLKGSWIEINNNGPKKS